MWVAEWNESVITDESRICLQHYDGRIRVWRHRGERMLNSRVMHHHTGPEPGIMITPPAATPDYLWQRVEEAAWFAVPQEHIQSPLAHFTEVIKFNHLILGQIVVYKINFIVLSLLCQQCK
ncbi:transposable element Tcb1 transposase [Trichonephila clavipes]|nr:transposable element Tcb1 transposase [Trichonephila clavipes]